MISSSVNPLSAEQIISLNICSENFNFNLTENNRKFENQQTKMPSRQIIWPNVFISLEFLYFYRWLSIQQMVTKGHGISSQYFYRKQSTYELVFRCTKLQFYRLFLQETFFHFNDEIDATEKFIIEVQTKARVKRVFSVF